MNWNKNDTKAFFIGMIASASAVVLWDVVKKSRSFTRAHIFKRNFSARICFFMFFRISDYSKYIPANILKFVENKVGNDKINLKISTEPIS